MSNNERALCRNCLKEIWSPEGNPDNCRNYCCSCCPDKNKRNCARDIKFGNPLEQLKK